MDSQEELAGLKADAYRGIARIPLDCLNFDNKITRKKHRSLSLKNVLRVQKIFTRVGCQRLDATNYINGVVADSDLENALRLTQANAQQLLSFKEGDNLPLLNLRVECLSGLHRVEAAKSFLSDNDQWWVVRLFNKGAPEPVLSRIVEHYTNEQRPSDGTVFWKIRYYHKNKDFDSENQWWAYLDKSKPKDLRQLLKSWSLTDAFDSLLDMPGLWDRVQLGALHRLLALKCEEEMVLYLEHVKKTWLRIFEGTGLDYSVVDSSTAQKLELLCPKYRKDKREIATLFEKRVVFPSVLDETDRNLLRDNIYKQNTLIPTLWTFFETLKFLEPVCEPLKHLLGDRLRGSIRKSFMGCYFQPETTFLQIRPGYKAEVLESHNMKELAYTELWVFCARHFDELTTFTPKKDKGTPKPSIKGPNPIIWQRLAQLAASVGFSTPTIKAELGKDSHKNLAIEYLHKSNPMSTIFSEIQIQKVITASCYGLLEHQNEETDSESLNQERRCGRPFEFDSSSDKTLLFLPILCREHCSEEVDLRFVRKDLFQCLFGPFTLKTGPEIPDLATTISSGDPTDSQPNKKRRLDQEPEGPVQSLQQEIMRLKRENIGLRKLLKQPDSNDRTRQTHQQLPSFPQFPQSQFEPQLENVESLRQETQDVDRNMVDESDVEVILTRHLDKDSWEVGTGQDVNNREVVPMMRGEDLITKMIQLDHVIQCSAFPQHLAPWYELFYIIKIDQRTKKHGISFAISNDEDTGLKQLRIILSSLKRQKEPIGDFRAVTRAGTTIVGLEAESIYDGCSVHNRVFIGLAGMMMMDVMPNGEIQDDEL